jgi:hypothetical protein
MELTTIGRHIHNENINSTKKDTESVVEASKEVGLEVIIEKLKYMFCHFTRMQDKIIIQL